MAKPGDPASYDAAYPCKLQEPPLHPDDEAEGSELDHLLVNGADGNTPQETVYRSAILITAPVFMGYAGLASFQEHIKRRIGIPDGKNHESYLFGVAVSCLWFSTAAFRFMHSVFLSYLRPHQRVMLAYVIMATTMTLLPCIYWFGDVKSLVPVFMCYLLGGVAVGTFESNLVSCLTPLGHGTKSWSLMGMPVGYNGISVGAFILFAALPKNFAVQVSVFLFIAACNIVGLVYYACYFPYHPFEASGDNVKKFFHDVRHGSSQWLPPIVWHCVALFTNMFSVILFGCIVFYIYDTETVELWPGSTTMVPSAAVQAAYNFAGLLGDASSRKIVYVRKTPLLPSPLLYLVFDAVGGAIVMTKVALIAPIGMFLIMFGNGSIYATTTKRIDVSVPKTFNLVALSMWLFIGDAGSLIGAQLVQYVRGVAGRADH